MSLKPIYRIKIVTNEGPAPSYVWHIYAPDAAEPFVTARSSFKTEKAAVADAQLLLSKHKRTGIVEKTAARRGS